MSNKTPLIEVADVNTCMIYHQDVKDETILESLKQHMINICNELSKFPIKPKKISFDASRVYKLDNSKIAVPLHIELEVEFTDSTEQQNSFKTYISNSKHIKNPSRTVLRAIQTPKYYEEYKKDFKTIDSSTLWNKMIELINELNTPKLDFSWNKESKFFEIKTQDFVHSIEGH